MIGELNDDQLKCLNSWPQGTTGHIEDEQLITLMNLLCKRHGYGRVSQLAQAVEEIWRNPEEGGKKWQEFHDERMTLVQGTVAFYAAKREGKSDEEAHQEGFAAMANIFGFRIEEASIPDAVSALFAERNRLRADKRWAEADEVKKKIIAQGFQVRDNPNGSSTILKG